MKNDKNFKQSLFYAELISGYLAGTLSNDDHEKLKNWLEEDPQNKVLFQRLTNIENIKDDISLANSFDENKAYVSIQKNISLHTIDSRNHRTNTPNYSKWWDTLFKNLNLTTVGISLAALFICFSFVWMYLKKDFNSIKKVNIAQNYDVEAAKEGATLILPNGKKIRLGDVSKGKLLQENGITISKTVDGKLLYEIRQHNDSMVKNDTSLNVLSTARGETYSVKLPDGSIVKLNSESSITYAMNFLHTQKRKITLSGEAYFEVAHHSDKPFIIHYKNQMAEVLGTAFNINAYDNENVVITTLVNGSLRVSTPLGPPKILSPGNAAFYDGKTIKTTAVDLAEYTAWRHGKFYFNKSPFDEVARQFSRWYDIDIQYVNGKVPNTKFSGEMNRNVSLKTVLSYFKELGIKFKLENRKLIVE